MQLSTLQDRLRMRARKEREPLSCLFELTPTCNLRCHFCYVALDPYKGPYLSTAQVCGILDRIADAGVLWLTFTGGEIFSRKDFPAIYHYAKEKGFLVTLFSNATMVNESIAEMLRASPPFAMEVSIYGADQEHYEGTTGIKGSFARFVRGIRLLQEANVPLTLKTPFSDVTADHGEALLAFCRERDIPFRYDFSLSPRHDGGQQPTLHRIAPRRVAEMRGALLAEERRNERFEEPDCSEAPIGNRAASNDLYQCGAGRVGFFIDGLGYASHCVIDREPRFSLLEMSWDDVWAGIGEWVTQKLPDDAPCSGCSLRGGCNNCPARSRLATGSPYLKDTYFCDTTHAMHGLEPVQHPDYRAMARERPLGTCVR